jgi:hypothetical protein
MAEGLADWTTLDPVRRPLAAFDQARLAHFTPNGFGIGTANARGK